jgi:hypothetical protein
MLHPLPVRGKGGLAVKPVHRPVERGVRTPQVRRHQVGVVKLRERRAGMRGTGIEDGLGEWIERR